MSKLTGPIRFTARARAKVNLALEVLFRRKDGFHEVETILQSIDFFDEIDVQFDTSGEIRISCSDPDIPTDSKNLCYRAVERMRPLVHPHLGATVHIDKRIPHSAGLGGGSADAGAIILAAHQAGGGGNPLTQLEMVAAELGSDVPFMLRGGTMLGQGRGERVTPLTPLGGGVFLIVKPPLQISTADAYSGVNLTLTKHRYRINLKQVNTLLSRFPNAVLTFRNALEDVVCPSYPVLADTLEELLASRPRFAAMTGSGAALFGIYDTEARASELADTFSVRGFFTAVALPATRAVDLFAAEPR